MKLESPTHGMKFARLTFASTPLGEILEGLRGRYEAEKAPEILVVPYVIMCAAYLEAKLNDSLFQHALTKYGEEVAAAHISMSLPKKLGVVVPLLTNGQYSINKRHFVYERLMSLIRVRNSLVHAKSEFEELKGSDGATKRAASPGTLQDVSAIGVWFPPNLSFDLTMGAAKSFSPIEYHDALEKFDKWFFQRCPDRLSKVAMVVREEHGHWQQNSVQLTKRL